MMTSIDDYIGRLARQLPRHLQAEVLPEIRGHLLDLAADWRNKGLGEAEAEARAVAQFGPAHVVGRQLSSVHGLVGWGDVVLAALPVLGITGLGWHFIGGLLPLWWYLLAFGWGALFAWRRNWPTWWFAWLGWLFLALGVVNETRLLFWIIFPLAITLVAIDSWERATLMALPFTTYMAFIQLLDTTTLLHTTGWGPGSLYPGNFIWLETAFSLLWIVILAMSIRLARPQRQGIYLLAGLLTTQALYLGMLFAALALSKFLPELFISSLTVRLTLTTKLPLAGLVFGLTLYPFCVSLAIRWLRQLQWPGQPGLFSG
jgi:hypothetical protein